jgi:hypothetical protein
LTKVQKTSPAHIPGPWAVSPDDREDMEWNNHIVFGDGSHTICFMAHAGHADSDLQRAFEATAHLIAAAPDLYAALSDAIDTIIWMSGSPSFSPEGEAHEGWLKQRENISRYMAALAKAKGDVA